MFTDIMVIPVFTRKEDGLPLVLFKDPADEYWKWMVNNFDFVPKDCKCDSAESALEHLKTFVMHAAICRKYDDYGLFLVKRISKIIDFNLKDAVNKIWERAERMGKCSLRYELPSKEAKVGITFQNWLWFWDIDGVSTNEYFESPQSALEDLKRYLKKAPETLEMVGSQIFAASIVDDKVVFLQ